MTLELFCEVMSHVVHYKMASFSVGEMITILFEKYEPWRQKQPEHLMLGGQEGDSGLERNTNPR